MSKRVRISLANKCQLLFGAAVLLILTVALAVVWLRMEILVDESQEAIARQLANAWLADMIQLGEAMAPHGRGPAEEGEQGLTMTLLEKEEFAFARRRDPRYGRFLTDAIAYFQTHTDQHEFSDPTYADGQQLFRYARAIRKSDLSQIRGGAAAGYRSTVDVPMIADPLEMVLLVELRTEIGPRLLNRVYIVAAGVLAGLLAIGTFWYITTRLILSPVRVLRDTAEKVSEGDLNIRSDINTGDEFEQLSDMFNTMLKNLKLNQDQLRSINKSLDLKLGELAEHNVALYEANKIKDEFLANVSHELRTPLNSIIGFGEVLQETLKERTGPVDEKRKRYVANIIASSRQLLDLINDLLDLAKIEAGRFELRVGPMSVLDTMEGLVNLMRPQADKKQIELVVNCPRTLPMVQTDAGKFQQILFNFLSNAMKFTPPGGRVTIEARLMGLGQSGERLKVSVSDTGPGIPKEQHGRIFEKFTQLDSTVTREHTGTGLGLTISRELSHLLQGQVTLESEVGKGATFSVIIPLVIAAPSAGRSEGAVAETSLS